MSRDLHLLFKRVFSLGAFCEPPPLKAGCGRDLPPTCPLIVAGIFLPIGKISTKSSSNRAGTIVFSENIHLVPNLHKLYRRDALHAPLPGRRWRASFPTPQYPFPPSFPPDKPSTWIDSTQSGLEVNSDPRVHDWTVAQCRGMQSKLRGCGVKEGGASICCALCRE